MRSLRGPAAVAAILLSMIIISCAELVVDPLQETPEPPTEPEEPDPPTPPVPPPLDFTFDYGLTELKRSRLLLNPSAVFLQSSFLPTDETVSIRRAELIFWLRKPGQFKVLLFHEGSGTTFDAWAAGQGEIRHLQTMLSHMDRRLDRWPTWSDGYTELIVQATADLQPASSTERTKVSKTVIVPLIQDGPPLEGVLYLLDLTFIADLSNDPEDTSYLPWRHWIVAENDYEGGLPRFESAKVPFQQSESHPFVRVFRPEDESLSERVTLVIDKDGDDLADFSWVLDREDLPVADDKRMILIVGHFGVEGQTDIEIW